MTGLVLSDNHHFLQASHDINAICKPLFKHYELSQFVYGKYYENGTGILLSNNSDWIHHHLKSGYILPAPVPNSLLTKKEAYHLIPNDGPFHQAKHDLLNMFNSGDAVDLIFKHKNYYEVFCYAFPTNFRHSVNVIMNNLDTLKDFASHFRLHAKSILNIAEKNLIHIPEKMLGIDVKSLNKSSPNDLAKSLPWNNQTHNMLTKREKEILYYLVRGKSAKKIADIFCLSRRTIEQHFQHIKRKSNSSSKAELIEKYFNDFIW